MDNPQYFNNSQAVNVTTVAGFKPYYKWITLNTELFL